MDTNNIKTKEVQDVCIVGLGATGLYALYCANLLELKGIAIECHDDVGGQVYELVKDRYIYDLPCLLKTDGNGVIKSLKQQIDSIPQTIKTIKKKSVLKLKTLASGCHEITLSDNQTIKTKNILITAGNGAYVPRTWALPKFTNVVHQIANFSQFDNKKIVICGGGESALKAVQALANRQTISQKIILIHRNSRFQASKSLITAILNHPRIEVLTNYDISPVNYTCDRNILKTVQINNLNNQVRDIKADIFIIQYGVTINLVGIKNWPLNFNHTGQIIVNQQQQTNIKGIYCAGDAADYIGKTANLTIGFGEAATALYNINKNINGEDPIKYFGDHKVI